MEIYAPQEYSFDIVELLCNGQSVTKTVLPNGKLTTIPFVFSNLDNCELRFSKLGEVIAVGNFKDDKLYIAIKSDTNQSTSCLLQHFLPFVFHLPYGPTILLPQLK